MTINVHGIDTPEVLTIYFDQQSHDSILSHYPHKVRVRGIKKLPLQKTRRIYHFELKDLEPGQRYYFSIGDESSLYGQEQHFLTVPLTPPFLFIEGGDWENTLEAEKLAQRAAKLSPHAVFLGGDYPSHVFGLGGYKKWDQWLDVYTKNMVTPDGDLIPMVMAIGNHEVIGGFDQPKKQVPFFFRYFPQGETGESYFSLPFGRDVRLFVLDSGHTAIHEGAQCEWLEKELSQANESVKIALYHVPLFPSIRFAEKDMIYRSVYGLVAFYKNERTADKLFSEESQKGRQFWLPLFDRFGLTVAFEHHDQALKRTKLLKNGRIDPRGTLYLGDGGWGPKVQYRPVQGYFHRYFAKLRGQVHFFWAVKIEKEKIFYWAVTDSGEVIDRFIQYLY